MSLITARPATTPLRLFRALGSRIFVVALLWSGVGPSVGASVWLIAGVVVGGWFIVVRQVQTRRSPQCGPPRGPLTKVDRTV